MPRNSLQKFVLRCTLWQFSKGSRSRVRFFFFSSSSFTVSRSVTAHEAIFSPNLFSRCPQRAALLRGWRMTRPFSLREQLADTFARQSARRSPKLCRRRPQTLFSAVFKCFVFFTKHLRHFETDIEESHHHLLFTPFIYKLKRVSLKIDEVRKIFNLCHSFQKLLSWIQIFKLQTP